MAEFVTIRHESQEPTAPTARVTVKAFEGHYREKGWKQVGDAPATPSDPSPTVEEQARLLQTDPDALGEILAPDAPPAVYTDAELEIVRDPASADAAAVIALIQAHPEVAAEVAESERANKNRTTVLRAADAASEQKGGAQ